jgi:hypothetical protein
MSSWTSSSVILKNTTFRELNLFPSSGEEVGDTDSVGSLRKSYSLGCPPTLSFEDGNRSSFRNVVVFRI